MAGPNHDFAQLFKQYFGYKGLPLLPQNVVASVPEPFGMATLPVGELQVMQYGLLGAPLMLPTKIDDIQLPNEPLVSITGGKNIVKTEINGVDGTFKEEWTLRDYEITIRGFLIDENDPDNLPERMIRDLRLMSEKKNSRKIVNRLLTIFNINMISIEEWEFPDNQGAIGIQPYMIKGCSDKEFELEIKPTA